MIGSGPDVRQQAQMRTRGTVRRAIRWSIGIGLTSYVIWFAVDHRAFFSERFAGTMQHAILLALGIGATWVVNSLQTLLPLRELGVRIGFWENLLLTMAVVFGNYLPLRAGTALRLHYVKSVYGVGLLRHGGVLGARALLLLCGAGVVGLCGTLSMAVTDTRVRLELLLLFASITAAGVAPFLFPLQRILPQHGTFGRMAAQFTEAIGIVRRNHWMTACYLGLVVLQFAIIAGRLSVAFDVIQQQPGPWVYYLLGPVAAILSFVSITPGNLGLHEWLVGVVSSGVGIDYAAGIFAASVDRAVLLVMTLSLGGLAMAIVAFRLSHHNADAATRRVSY